MPSNGRNLDLVHHLVPKMKEIAAIVVKSTYMGLNMEQKDRNFEVFGLDFMIDEDFRPWLIEVNTNPCLEMSSPILQRLVPYLIENTLRMGLDTMFPPPDNFGNNLKYNIPENAMHYNRYELIFDSERDGGILRKLYEGGGNFFRRMEGLEEDKSEFKQEGEIINVD